jgi:hypothetical protein
LLIQTKQCVYIAGFSLVDSGMHAIVRPAEASLLERWRWAVPSSKSSNDSWLATAVESTLRLAIPSSNSQSWLPAHVSKKSARTNRRRTVLMQFGRQLNTHRLGTPERRIGLDSRFGKELLLYFGVSAKRVGCIYRKQFGTRPSRISF